MPVITNFRSTAQTATTITLNWSNCNPSNPGTLHMAVGFGLFNQEFGLTAGLETYVVTSLAYATDYRFYIRIGSEASPIITVRTSNGPSAPTAPSALTGETNGSRAITWAWTDNSSSPQEEGFEVEVTEILTGIVTYVTTAVGVTTTVSTGIPANLYQGRVRATHATLGPSEWSGPAFAATRAWEVGGGGTVGTPPLPQPPHNFRFWDSTETSARFLWSYSGVTHSGFAFYVYRSDGTLVRRQVGDASLRGWTARALLSDTAYLARVAAIGESGETLAENTVEFRTQSGQRPLPTPPTSVVATEIGPGDVRITFDASLSNADNLILYRDTVPASLEVEVADDIVPTATEYIETGLAGAFAAQDLRYWLKAENSRGLSAASDTDDVNITAPGEILTPPYAHTLVAIDTATLLAVWEQDGSVHDGFTLEISAVSDAGPWTVISDAIGSWVRSYVITGRTGGTEYWTRVTATADGFPSDPSNVATATTPEAEVLPAPIGPVIDRVEVPSPTFARAYFTSRSAYVASYQARISVNGGAYASHGAAVLPTATYIDLASLSSETTYDVVIRATSAGGTGDSDPEEFDTPPDGGGLGWAGRNRGEIQFARGYTNDDDDITVFSAAPGGSINFRAVPPHATDGPFATLFINAVQVGSPGYGGETRLSGHQITAGDAITVQFSGAGTGTGHMTLLFKPD